MVTKDDKGKPAADKESNSPASAAPTVGSGTPGTPASHTEPAVTPAPDSSLSATRGPGVGGPTTGEPVRGTAPGDPAETVVTGVVRAPTVSISGTASPDPDSEPPDAGYTDTVTQTGQGAKPSPEFARTAGIREGEGEVPAPQYQAAGQARQIRNELRLLTEYGSGDSERAQALRKDLRALGHDPDAPEPAADPPGGPVGRTTRAGHHVRTEGGAAASGGDVEVSPAPATGSGAVTPTTAAPKTAKSGDSRT